MYAKYFLAPPSTFFLPWIRIALVSVGSKNKSTVLRYVATVVFTMYGRLWLSNLYLLVAFNGSTYIISIIRYEICFEFR